MKTITKSEFFDLITSELLPAMTAYLETIPDNAGQYSREMFKNQLDRFERAFAEYMIVSDGLKGLFGFPRLDIHIDTAGVWAVGVSIYVNFEKRSATVSWSCTERSLISARVALRNYERAVELAELVQAFFDSTPEVEE